jgi:hypothetical protein
LELKKLDTARDIVENLSKSKNVSFIPSGATGSGSNFLFKV